MRCHDNEWIGCFFRQACEDECWISLFNDDADGSLLRERLSNFFQVGAALRAPILEQGSKEFLLLHRTEPNRNFEDGH